MEPEANKPAEDDAPWMATFADLATLLFTFFVLLLSFANLDIVKFREMMGSVQDAMGYQTVAHGNWNPKHLAVKPDGSAPDASKEGQPGRDLEMLEYVQEIITQNELKPNVEAIASPRGVIIRVKNSLMFRPGSDRLRPASFAFFAGMIALMNKYPYEVLVEGHTDNTPIKTARFPSNWELSTARAIAAMRYLMEVGGIPAKRLGAAGYADARPLVPGKSRAARAKNRRVEFVCLRPFGRAQDRPTRSSQAANP